MSLRAEALNLAYGGRRILHDLTLHPIAQGSLVAVLGPNGVGKSSLLRALGGLQACAGQAHFGESPLLGVPPWKQRERVAYLPQQLPQTTSLLAYESLQGACRARCPALSGIAVRERIAEVLAMLGIGDLALRRLDELSGGQRQLVGLAQVMVGTPDLLLLDEPTSALDLHWQLRVLEAVHRLTREQGSIGLLACHDLNLALRFCDQLLLLAPGGRYRQGPAEQVLDPDWLRLAYGVEARIERCSQGFPLVLVDRPLADHR